MEKILIRRLHVTLLTVRQKLKQTRPHHREINMNNSPPLRVSVFCHTNTYTHKHTRLPASSARLTPVTIETELHSKRQPGPKDLGGGGGGVLLLWGLRGKNKSFKKREREEMWIFTQLLPMQWYAHKHKQTWASSRSPLTSLDGAYYFISKNIIIS